MDRKLYYILSAVFMIMSGILYTIERGIAYFTWVGQMIASSHTESCPINPQMPGLLSNLYIPIFVIISLILCILGYRKK